MSFARWTFKFWEWIGVLWQAHKCWRFLSRVRKHVPKIYTGIIRLPILGSNWKLQGQIHWGLPARKGNSSRQSNSKNAGQRTLVKLILKCWENGHRTKTARQLLKLQSVSTSFWYVRVLRLQASWHGSLGNIPMRTLPQGKMLTWHLLPTSRRKLG